MEKDQQFVLDNIVMLPETGCWLWYKSWTDTGYGQFHRNKKHSYAHRFAYTAFVGPVPDGLCVLHKCDTRSCVNPEHLLVGDKRDNILDAKAKSRLNPKKGSSNYLAKLDEDKVIEIRSSTETNAALARKFAVDPSVISDVRRDKIWRHI